MHPHPVKQPNLTRKFRLGAELHRSPPLSLEAQIAAESRRPTTCIGEHGAAML